MSIADKLQRLSDARDDIITALAAKGVTASGHGFEDFPDDIGDIPAGATLQTVTGVTPTTSSQTIEPDEGYDGLASVQIDAMPSGTEGTPTATKGTVSGNAVTVTPSVTNVAGYISGGTHTGTGVSVSASELVSGTKSITSAGTHDVTTYASASVASGSATTPTTSITANPEIMVSASGNIKATTSATQSVTPTVSAGYVSAGTAGNVSVSGLTNYQLTTQGAQTITPTTSDQTIASGTYLTGTQTVEGIVCTNLTAANIASGVTVKIGTATDDDSVTSVTGTHSGGGSYGKATTTLASTASSISFTGLTGAPTAFAVVVKESLTTASRIVCVVHDGADTFGAYSSARGTAYDGTIFTYSYSSGTLTVTVSGTKYFHNATYELLYTTASPASSWTLLGSTDLIVSTTSTTAESAGSISIGSAAWTSAKIIYVKVRDKAGPRAGYFLGSDTFFFNYNAANSATATLTYAARTIHRYASNSTYAAYTTSTSTGYGVYGYSITSAGEVNIYRRYNSSYSLTINGTYNVEVYALDYAPNTGNPFDFSFS